MTKNDVKLICENDEQMQWWAMVLFAEICDLADATIDDPATFAKLARCKTDEFPGLVVQNQLNKFKNYRKKRLKMWNDFVIGEDTKDSGAVCLHKYPGISKSGDSFWLTEDSNHLGLSGRINYKTTQGESINAWIEDKLGVDEMKNFITHFVVKEITVNQLILAIDKLQQSAYDEGRRDLQIEFKNLLGVKHVDA